MMHYTAPAGALGEAVAKVFANPEERVAQDLENFTPKATSSGCRRTRAMPYSTIEELPGSVKDNLPRHAQDV